MFSDSCDYRRQSLRANGAGVAVMYTKQVEHDREPLRATTGVPARTACCSRTSPTGGSSDNRFAGNSTGLLPRGIEPPAGPRQRVRPQRLGDQASWPTRTTTGSSDNTFHRQHLRRDHQRRSTLRAVLRRQPVGRVPRLRPRPRRLRGRAPPPRAPLLAPGAGQRAGADPAAQRLRDLLDLAERVLPVLSPKGLVDKRPRMPGNPAVTAALEVRGLRKTVRPAPGAQGHRPRGGDRSRDGHRGTERRRQVHPHQVHPRPGAPGRRSRSRCSASRWGAIPHYRHAVGYMPQAAAIPRRTSPGGEVLAFLADLRGGDEPDEELSDRFHLEGALDKPVRALSGGTRQKLNAVVAFRHRAAAAHPRRAHGEPRPARERHPQGSRAAAMPARGRRCCSPPT